ncbi:ANTAR domain-containing protein [Streptomyces longisporoflavus]|uniref:ANTAR domain-containing protein n=1 Tax=Streptomyces longisporoflavus TaxID=28044 RepID=A0ABW7QIF9_9ACTN
MSTDSNDSSLGTTASDSEPLLGLQDEVQQLKQAMWAHAAVDQAIGVIIAVGRLSPDAAWDVIRTVSMRTNTKVRDVAQQVIAFAITGELAPRLRREMKRQIRQHHEADAKSSQHRDLPGSD